MKKRGVIGIGMALAMLWSVAVVGFVQMFNVPFVPLNSAMVFALMPGGLVMILLVARLAQRRFFDVTLIDGAAFVPGSGGDIDQRVLTNTGEQLLLAALLWPFVALTLGGYLVMVMGVFFAIARLLFWVGYHLSPPLRALGFGATFYPTVLAVAWSFAVWIF